MRAGVLVRAAEGTRTRLAHDLFRETISVRLAVPQRLALHHSVPAQRPRARPSCPSGRSRLPASSTTRRRWPHACWPAMTRCGSPAAPPNGSTSRERSRSWRSAPETPRGTPKGCCSPPTPCSKRARRRFGPRCATFSPAAKRFGQPRHDYLVLTRRGALAMIDGRLDDADELIAQASALGERIGEPDTGNVRMSQLLRLVRARDEPARLRATAAEAIRWWTGAPSHAGRWHPNNDHAHDRSIIQRSSADWAIRHGLPPQLTTCINGANSDVYRAKCENRSCCGYRRCPQGVFHSTCYRWSPPLISTRCSRRRPDCLTSARDQGGMR